MDSTSTDICPLCRFPIGPDRACTNPACRARLDKGDWALPDVYGSTGLLLPETEGGPFRVPRAIGFGRTEPGGILSPLPLSLDPKDAVYHLGGSPENRIQVSGAKSPHQVSFHLHRPTEEWWVFDWGGGSDATLNGERFRNRKLKDDDILQVAGAQLRYRSGRISAEYGTVDGVDLFVSRLTDRRMSPGNHSHPLLDRVSFVIPDGEFVGVIGPSGCGKSTLVKTLAGLVRPDEGSIVKFNGVSRDENSRGIRACTAYLPQNVDATLHDGLTLGQEIASFSSIHAATRDKDREDALLRDLKLSREFRIGDMSGGQRRRAAFLLAMLRAPSVLLLDEPSAGLDRATESALMEDLRRMTRSGTRKTIVCATHELANIHLFDRVLVLADGQLAYDGPPDGLFDALEIPGGGNDRFQVLYGRLNEASRHPAIQDEIRKNQERNLPHPLETSVPLHPGQASRIGCFCGYLGRFVKTAVAFVRRPVAPPADGTPPAIAMWIVRQATKWVLNAPLVGFVWQPFLVAICLCTALKSSYGGDDPTVFFCAAIAAFWLGMAGSVRALVATRTGRCLERLEGVPRVSYLGAVLSSSLVRGLLQGAVLCAFLYWIPFLDGREGQWLQSAAVGIGACLVAVAWMGGGIGLALSALAPSETFAVTMVPNLAIVALFFSEPLMGSENANAFAKLLPAHAAYRTMEALNDPNVPYAWWILPVAVLAWMAGALAVAALAQTLYEKNWRG